MNFAMPEYERQSYQCNIYFVYQKLQRKQHFSFCEGKTWLPKKDDLNVVPHYKSASFPSSLITQPKRVSWA